MSTQVSKLMEQKRKATEKAQKRKATLKAAAEMIAFLRPPKSAKNDYLEQKPAKYVFKCMDGDIQIPEYGILRTEFYYQERVDQLKKPIDNYREFMHFTNGREPR